jgi:Ger(x)C family germination protein
MTLEEYEKRFKAVAMMILLFVLLTGCADSVDINDKLIVTTIIFDKKDGDIWYYLEIADTAASQSKDTGSSASDKYFVMKGHGKTLVEVRDNLDTQLDKPLYLSGVRALVFTESFAKEHLVEYLYRFRVDETYRKKGLTVITKEEPEEMFKSAHEKNDSVGFQIEGILKTLEKTGKSFSRTTIRLLENLSSEYTGFLIPCVGLRHENLALIGYSVVSGPAVTGFIPLEESTGMTFLKTDKPKFHFIVPYNDMNFTIEVVLTKRKIKPSYENGKISFDIGMDCKAEVLYGDKKTPYYFEETAAAEVAETLSGMLKEQFSDAITRAQKEFSCDYLQFDDVFRVKYPVEFESMDWQKEFPGTSMNMDVKVELSTRWGLDYGSYEAR